MDVNFEAYKKLPVAKANTQLDLECISIQRDLIGEPVAIHTSDGLAYRLENGKLEKMVNEAHNPTFQGHAPDDLGLRKLIEMLQKVLDNAPKDEPEQATQTLNAVVDEIASKLASQFETALKKALQRRQKEILLNAAEVLLG